MKLALASIVCLLLAALSLASEEQPTTLKGAILRPSENCKRTVGSNAKVTIHFKARAWGETEYFEDTYKTNQPFTYKLGRDKMMEGLKNGLQGMCEGEIRRVLMPADMAFGELGVPGKVPPNTAVVYDIEVMEVNAPFTNPWFYAGLGVIALVYVYMDRMAKAVDNAKLSKFMEKKAAQDNNSKKEQ
ncbi:hypothetical protein O0I10_011382 [Lichtheimia ornata]|uniref:peptidylprolyl isomerase n=1 Tax=Lichtheimia ornata TaxID=688661 RepID=A0AAD7XU74_9FUNG|nr:uncharacterized protein O0I10_011382 [Lichtheimia ornata]KAJ8653001.1 hypothetical protein O0I10_011382 [Lichtheimia ornata]